MVAPSKLYQSPLKELQCAHLLQHGSESCFEFFIRSCYRNSFSSAKYFLPLLITPLILKRKTLSGQVLFKILRNYLQTTIAPAIACAVAFSMMCILRSWFGEINKYTVWLGVYTGLHMVWLFPERPLRLFATTTSQAALEVLLRQRVLPFSSLILNSLLVQTLVFMTNSAIILHFKRQKAYSGFWFVNQIDKCERSKEEPAPTCEHGGISCRAFIFDGIKTYLRYGIPLDVLNVMMKRGMPRNKSTLVAQLRAVRFSTTAFFTSYIGLYRATSCLLSKFSTGKYSRANHFIAAFLGGASYLFLNKITICSMSIIIAVQALWQQLCSKPARGHIMKYLMKVPFGKICIPLNVAYLVHSFIYSHQSLNSLSRGFINGTSNYKAQQIYNYLTQNDMETLMTKNAICTI